MQMKWQISLGVLCFASVVAVQAGTYPKGEKIAAQVCAACHTADGNSVTPENPVLAGQVSEYIERQLSHFKSDVRPNPIMKGMASTLSEADMHELGLYFSEQKTKPRTSKEPKLVEQGRKIYRSGIEKAGVPACMACHGPAGIGIPAQYPRLAGQHASYILKQLKAFKHGERGAHKTDVLGKVMVDISTKLSDEDMAAVSEYVSALR
jgi:cytochrome c553